MGPIQGKHVHNIVDGLRAATTLVAIYHTSVTRLLDTCTQLGVELFLAKVGPICIAHVPTLQVLLRSYFIIFIIT